MVFETSRTIDMWVKKHREECKNRHHTTAGEEFEYEFLPTGIVQCQTVRCLFCKEKFTDYVD